MYVEHTKSRGLSSEQDILAGDLTGGINLLRRERVLGSHLAATRAQPSNVDSYSLC